MTHTPEELAMANASERLKSALEAGGPALTQCLLDLGLVRLDGNRLVRTRLGDHAIKKIDDMKGKP